MTFWVTCGCSVRKSQELYGFDQGGRWGVVEKLNQSREAGEVESALQQMLTFCCLRASPGKTMDITEWQHMPINKKAGSTEGNIDKGRSGVGVH